MFTLSPEFTLRREAFHSPVLSGCRPEQSEGSAFRRSSPRHPPILPACAAGANSFRIRTYLKSTRNPFRIRTSKTEHLKSFRIRIYEKTGRGAPEVRPGRSNHRIPPNRRLSAEAPL